MLLSDDMVLSYHDSEYDAPIIPTKSACFTNCFIKSNITCLGPLDRLYGGCYIA